ncbi:uncharacterized protein LOC123314094 [Coccinella septempunctata]|uniref:uncharacterized protein LOC123314094 n=1 Tax=Coccinella septempunctata TaxID=41139 RepID=UPI001D06B942|nr:uncharacterized protein LOC123314094 [Coccinella septempunctata]
MIWLYLLILIISLVYFYTKRSLTYWQRRNVFVESPVPLFGNLLSIALAKENLSSFIRRVYTDLGEKYPYFGFYLFHKPILILKDRDIIKQVLIKDFNSFTNRALKSHEKIDPISSNTLFVLRDQDWKTTRSKLSPVFTSGKMKLMLPLMTEIAHNLEKLLDKFNNKNIDAKDITKRFTIDVTTSCAFGIDSGSLTDENSEIKKNTDIILDQKSFMRRFASFSWVLCPTLVDLFRLPLIDLDSADYLVAIYLQSEADRKSRNVKRNDLIDLMIDLSREETTKDNFLFDDLKRSAQAVIFYNAGTEATSTLSSLCLYELALNPEIQDRLRSEIRQNLDSNGDLTYEALFGMEYLDLVTKETLRRYPFVPFLTRYADKDHIFETTGLKIEKGTQVIIPTVAIHGDPNYYPEPCKFDPERFRGDKMKDLQYVYLPFGEGPRRCIGERFAWMSLKLGIATFLKKYEVVPGEQTDIPLKFAKNAMFATTQDGRIHLKIKKCSELLDEILKDINIIKQVLVKDFNSFPNRTLHSNEKVDPVISNTLFVLKDDVWRTFRRKLSPIMSSGKMKLIIPSMQEHAVNLEHCLENSVEKNIDVKDLAKRFMLDAFASFAFGIDYGSLQNKNLLMKQEHDRVFDQTKVMRRIGTFSWVFSPILVDIFRLPFMDMKYAHNLLDFYLQAEIDRKKENIQRNDLLDILIELSQQKSPNNVHEFDDLRRSAQAVLFSGTGTESTALPLALGLHELACHPDIQDELRREIYQNLDIDGNVTYESLNKMKYLDMVVKETLRLHPFLPFVTRYASEDYKIESTGLIIEKGTQILVPTRAIHKDPKYFPEPLKFKPERFLGENMNKFQNVYLPFGAGPRKCIGEELSFKVAPQCEVRFIVSSIENLAEFVCKNTGKMIWLLLFIIAIFLLYKYTKHSLSYWKRKNVFTEEPYPFFGNFLNIALKKESMGYIFKRIYDTLDEKYPYFGVYVFHKPILVLKDRELIKQVLVKDFSSFYNRSNYSNEKVDPIASNTLFALRNEVWKTVRNKLSPVFTSGKMKLMLPLMAEIADNLEGHLDKSHDENVDVKDLTKRYAIDITTTCAFGIDSGSIKDNNSEIKTMTDKILDPRGFVRGFAAFCWILCPFLVDIFRLPFIDRDASNYFVDLFKHSEEERKRKNVKRNDLVDLLIEMSNEEKQTDLFKFDDVKKSAQALVFYNAGTEATSTLSSLCLYELALHQDIQLKLREEIRENVDDAGNISYEALFGMEYLDLVVKEILRKYPFVHFLARYAEKDYIFESTGLKIEKGTQVIVPTLAIHNDPKYYPEPSRFDPERFRGDKMKDLQYVYLPFGEGPRKCIGERFALMGMKLGIAAFLKKYEISPGEKTDIPLKLAKSAFFIATENGSLYLKIKKAN